MQRDRYEEFPLFSFFPDAEDHQMANGAPLFVLQKLPLRKKGQYQTSDANPTLTIQECPRMGMNEEKNITCSRMLGPKAYPGEKVMYSIKYRMQIPH